MQSFIWPEGDHSPWLTAALGLGEDLNVETMPILLAPELPAVLKPGCTTLLSCIVQKFCTAQLIS